MLLSHVVRISRSSLCRANTGMFKIQKQSQNASPNIGTSHEKALTEPITEETERAPLSAAPRDLMSPAASPALETVRPFDEVPGPALLKYMALGRRYLSEVGTHLTARLLTFGYNIGKVHSWGNSYRHLRYLFNEYGPVVRFVGPLGGDIVLTNDPRHIRSVYAQEGQYPVRSTLDSLDKYRLRRRQRFLSPFSIQGEAWSQQRSLADAPLAAAAQKYWRPLWETCDELTERVYQLRNSQDELPHDLYTELHKWAFDCLGYVMLDKRTAMLSAGVVSSQKDATWLYSALVGATRALIKCETGLQMWKWFDTPAWITLVDNCDTLESLIGKQVHFVEQELTVADKANVETDPESITLVRSLLTGENVTTEDVVTILMDMMIIGVNTTTSAIAFLLYNLARSQKVQKKRHSEIMCLSPNIDDYDFNSLKQNTPYLQACIKESLRLTPPIPILTRILPTSIVLDKFNIPRGTLVIMSTQDSALKESNFEDAARFNPDRWLRPDAAEYDAFASIPFGFGVRKCIGQSVAETAITMLTTKLIQKYKLEYHYWEIEPTSTFISRPNKPLKIRFTDRHLANVIVQ